MAENEIVVETEVAEKAPQEETSAKVAKESKGGFGAKVKEWFRKFTVKLKRKTQMIPLVVILITSLVYLCTIGTYAQVIENNSGIPNLGISMFVNTLMSILILPLFLNAFPKRKKPNIVYIVLVFVVLALLIGMDIMYYMNTKNFLKPLADVGITDELLREQYPAIYKAYGLLIMHMIFVGISIVVFALLPLYKKGINKINTRKVLEENNLSGEIDTSAEV